MIEQISIRGFKSFLDVQVELGRMNLFVGTNASGGRREMTVRSIANRNRFFALCPEVAELRDRIGATLN